MSEKLIYADELLKRTVLAGEIMNPHMEVIPAYFVREAPAVDAEPVRHARYIPDMNYRTLGNCGLCGGDVTCIQNYCPKCGAKMDGGKEV